MARRHELTDQQWETIKDLLPGKVGDPGRTAANNRLFVNAILFVLKTGIPWDDLPSRFGKPNTVWKRFDRWCKRDVWKWLSVTLGEDDLLDELQEVHLDSTIVKAHQIASTGQRLEDEKKVMPTAAMSWAKSRHIDDQDTCCNRPQRKID